MSEKERRFNQSQLDLSNEDNVKKILESGTPKELGQVREFYNLTPEQIKLLSDYAKLRKKTIEQARQELKERTATNPNATKEELNMGCYQEQIEPQVRDAVLNLRHKGYSTYESGFYGHNNQKISFEKNHLANIQIPEELMREFKSKGINIKVKPNSILFTCDKYFELDELEKFWNQIENILPNLQKPSEPCNLRAAISFRKKHS